MSNLSKYKILLIRIIILLVFLSISRMLMLILNLSSFNVTWFESFTLWFFGLRFDLSVLLMLNGLFILLYVLPSPFSSNKKYVRIIDVFVLTINSFALLINVSDAIYYRFTLRRTTFEIFEMFKANNGFVELIPTFLIDFWFVPFIVIFFSIFLVKLYLHFGKQIKTIVFSWKTYVVQTFVFLFVAGLIILGIRGGFQPIPIILIDAAAYTTANKVPLVLNTPFTILKTIESGSIDKISYYKEEELTKIYNPEHSFYSNDTTQIKKMNVVLIILESFSVEHFRYFNNKLEKGKYLGYTPFLDSLFKKSLVFNGIANGKRSIDGIPSIVSGLPNLMDRAFIISTYAGNKINSLAQILKKHSYNSVFFHGGENGTMNFDSYAKQASYDKYFGYNEYENKEDYDGNWGVWDEKFFQYYAHKMSEMKAPFFTTLFTLSSHHPYSIPAEHKNKFRKGKLPIQQAVMYADYSLKQFFKTASKMPWYNNTLFVITADHTSEGGLDFYKNSIGQYQVPIAFYAPADSTLKYKKVRKIVQQCDIFPSIIDYLNIESSFVAFGNSVFDTIAPDFGVNYSNNYIQLIKDEYYLRFANNEVKEFYNIKKDSLLKTNLVNSDIPAKKEMEKFIKAYIQQFQNRMIENRLSIERSK